MFTEVFLLFIYLLYNGSDIHANTPTVISQK